MKKYSPDLFEIIGMYVGDGCLSVNDRYKEFALSGDISEERDYYEKCVVPLFNRTVMNPLLNKKVKGKAYPSVGVFGFMIFNSKLVDYFLALGLKPGPKTSIILPRFITESKSELKTRFLRGLFDTDGSISFERNYAAKHHRHYRPRITIAMTSLHLKCQIANMLNELGIEFMDRSPYRGNKNWNTRYGIVIYRKRDVNIFIKKIGFRSSKHITKIKIWKKLGFCPPYTTLAERKNILKNINAEGRKLSSTGPVCSSSAFEPPKALSHRIS